MKSNIKSANCNMPSAEYVRIQPLVPSAEYARMHTLSGDDIALQTVGILITNSMHNGLYSVVVPFQLSENNISYLRNLGYNVNVSSVYEDHSAPIVTISWK